MTYNARTENAQPTIGPKGQPPDHPNLGPTTLDLNVGATATGSPAAIPRLVQRVWPRMMIGAMFVLEVAWIVFLVFTLVRFFF